MLEIKLLIIFAVCAAFLAISGIVIIGAAGKSDNAPRIFILLPVSKNTSDIEFLVRNFIYKAAEQYPEIAAILCNCGADDETVYIFEKLMTDSCKYYVADTQDTGSDPEISRFCR